MRIAVNTRLLLKGKLEGIGWVAYETLKRIVLGNGCWIGANVVILPGVTIGDGAVIGAGSVVTKDIPPNVVAVGSPCRVLREINKK